MFLRFQKLKSSDFYYHKLIKVPKFLGISCNHSKIQAKRSYDSVMCPKGADGMACSEDPDQTAPLGGILSGSALFAQTYLFENPRIITVLVELPIERFNSVKVDFACKQSHLYNLKL